jgi:hypothetical protein
VYIAQTPNSSLVRFCLSFSIFSKRSSVSAKARLTLASVRDLTVYNGCKVLSVLSVLSMVLGVKGPYKIRGREIHEKFHLRSRRADGRQQTAENRQQTGDRRQQTANSRQQQTADSRQLYPSRRADGTGSLCKLACSPVIHTIRNQSNQYDMLFLSAFRKFISVFSNLRVIRVLRICTCDPHFSLPL